MRILLIESSPGAAGSTAETLTAAGHPVLRCGRPGELSFPCRDVASPGTCPLDGPDPVDVVLDVRAPADVGATAAEAGVSCALRAGVPVAVDGAGDGHPFRGWTVDVGTDGPEAGCASAVAAGLEAEAAPLLAEVTSILRRSGESTEGVAVDVERSGTTTHILVTVPFEPLAGTGTIVARVHARHREATRRRSSLIEVGIRTGDL
jgi:hypothetical protein